MASVSLTVEEYNDLKEKEKNLGILNKEFELKVKESKQEYEFSLGKLKLDYDKELQKIESNKALVIVEVVGHTIPVNDALYYEDFNDYGFASSELILDELKKRNIVQLNEEIRRKTYVNIDDIISSIEKDVIRTNNEKFANDIHDLKSDLKSCSTMNEKLIKDIDTKDEELVDLKEKYESLSSNYSLTTQQVEKLTNMTKGFDSLDQKFRDTNQDLINTGMKLEDLRGVKVTLLDRIDVLNILNQKLEVKNSEITKILSGKDLEITDTLSKCNTAIEKKEGELRIELDKIIDREDELVNKYELFKRNRLIIVKDYDELSSISKYLIKKIYESNDIVEYNFNSKSIRNISTNNEFLNELNA